MNIIGLDIGSRHTGVSFADASEVPVALDTIEHSSFEELSAHLVRIIQERNVSHIVIGLPLLPDGSKGEQVRVVEDFAQKYLQGTIPCSFIDERHTSTAESGVDTHTSAAIAILTTYFDIQNG